MLANIHSGLFISDLHLFSPRSNGQNMASIIADRSQESDCIVLGGDIFDFRWSTRGSHDNTLRAANNWLTELLASTNVPIVYLVGNHDCHPDFLESLQALHSSEPRFTWAEHHLQLGECLFLHGDILDAGSHEGLASYRRKFHHTEPQSELAHRFYDVAVAMRIHRLVPKIRHAPSLTCKRLSELMKELPSVELASIRKVYFGHTHLAIHGIEVGGLQFFNPGAALKHMHVHIHPFEVKE